METASGGWWLVGWKQIARYCGRSIRTCKTYHYRYYMPVLRGPGNTPVAFPALLDTWLVNLDRIKREWKEERAKSGQGPGKTCETELKESQKD
jgi:hypothetical protein